MWKLQFCNNSDEFYFWVKPVGYFFVINYVIVNTDAVNIKNKTFVYKVLKL